MRDQSEIRREERAGRNSEELRGRWRGMAGKVCLAAVGCSLIAGLIVTATAGIGYSIGGGALEYLLIIALHVLPALLLRSVLSKRLPRVEVLTDTSAILVLMTALVVGYTTIKVQIPLVNQALWDAEFAACDRVLGLGMDLNVFLITIAAGAPQLAAQVMDTFYTSFVGMFLVFAAWFITHPERSHRLGFAAGWSMMWAGGALWYLATPSLGPVYFTTGLYQDVAAVFPIAAAMQSALISNYSALVDGTTTEIIHEYGVAAMPSLHVATHGFLWLWARSTASRLAPIFLAMTLLTWFGSVVTGWHWAVDGLAGLFLAWICCRAGQYCAGITRTPPGKPRIPQEESSD